MALKIVSYYAKGNSNAHFMLWVDGIGVALPSKLGKIDYIVLNCDVPVINRQYDVVKGDFDIAYCQLYAMPKDRPASFVYTFLSDYIGYEDKVKEWISIVRPNLLCSLQCVTGDLIKFCATYGCIVKLMPWFVLDKGIYSNKTIEGMCTGCINKVYPSRRNLFEHLMVKQRKDILLSCSENFGVYPLSNNAYIESIKKTKYYFSGGVYDKFIPPKYYEVCNHGACLVSFDMPEMERCGFVDGETYIKLNSIDDVDKILDTESYIEIGKAAQRMIHMRHTVDSRAKEVLEVYNNVQ